MCQMSFLYLNQQWQTTAGTQGTDDVRRKLPTGPNPVNLGALFRGSTVPRVH